MRATSPLPGSNADCVASSEPPRLRLHTNASRVRGVFFGQPGVADGLVLAARGEDEFTKERAGGDGTQDADVQWRKS
jgi:hypothetical protein